MKEVQGHFFFWGGVNARPWGRSVTGVVRSPRPFCMVGVGGWGGRHGRTNRDAGLGDRPGDCGWASSSGDSRRRVIGLVCLRYQTGAVRPSFFFDAVVSRFAYFPRRVTR